jgi:hypothetical protein
MAIQVNDRIRIKLKSGQCPECYLTPCDCANVFFAEPEPEEAPEMPTKDYPHANALLGINWAEQLISLAAFVGFVLIALGGLYLVYRLKLAGWLN